jgi:pilus assembly protein CpaB
MWRTNEAILASKLADSGLRGIIPLIQPGNAGPEHQGGPGGGSGGVRDPQTRVDVILIMTPAGKSGPGEQGHPPEHPGPGCRAGDPGDGGRQARHRSVVTVLVTPEEAEKLALASNEGELRLALRNTLDMESVETAGREKVQALRRG